MHSRHKAPVWILLGCLLGLAAGTQLPWGEADEAPGGIVATSTQPREFTSYRDVVKRVLPAVVSIQVTSKPSRASRANAALDDADPFADLPFPDSAFRRYFEEMRKRSGDVEVNPRSPFGSGVIVDPKGIVVTNHHVVASAQQVEVQLKDGRKFTSKLFHSDPKTDLAIIKLSASESLPYLEFGDSDAMEIGDRVLAVGAPFGLAGTVTHGIISGKSRRLALNLYEDFLQTDAPINPGNSGGPLVSLDGKVIGINSAIKTVSGGFQGIGLAIPSNMVRGIVNQLAKDGAVRRGYLGIQMQDLTEELAKRLGVSGQKGQVVTRVFTDTPAAKAGLKEGDVIVRFAGKIVETGRDLQRSVETAVIGKALDVSVLRDGKRESLSITIEQQPDDFGRSSD